MPEACSQTKTNLDKRNAILSGNSERCACVDGGYDSSGVVLQVHPYVHAAGRRVRNRPAVTT